MDLMYAAHVPSGEGPFPTILMLHGWGANAHDLLGLAPVLHGGQALVLCPQGPVAFEISQGMLGFGWWPITEDREIDPVAFDSASKAVESFLDEAGRRYPIDPRKTVVVGFSQGGVMAYDLVLRNPERFAGLVALSSWLPDHVEKGVPSQPGLENFPALLIHGTEDPMIPVERAQESRQKLLARGLNVHYREYEMQHEIRPEALRELVVWLEEKVFNLIQLA
ncbi:MAG: dienelactone hydrolase family protein [Deltaproteobacteria bacterium]|nr:dienelactone hydrolase family protein [Deltaproteobacteria bacterium]MBW2396079.1 dienelactone hydrolase family protein [Deltaproteobacteria bacterium]